MPYVVSFKIVIGKKDSAIHAIPVSHDDSMTVCGIPSNDTVEFIHVAMMGWCPKCHDAYLQRDRKEFALIK